MISTEYLRFLQTLNADAITEDERKLDNLVLANLEQLIPLGTHQGQRLQYVVSLAQAGWNSLSAEIQPIPERKIRHPQFY